MKFNCDRFPDFIRAKRRSRHDRLAAWHDYFTFFPEKLEHGDCRWLETIECRRIHYDAFFGWEWEYRAKS